MLARDSYGKVIISSWDFIGQCTSVDEVELRACLAGLCIGITLHNPIILETDCAFVAAALTNENFDRSPPVNLNKEVMSISKLINNFEASKINRFGQRGGSLDCKV